MRTTGNTILITGGGTGIGRGLAEAFHALGNKVIIAGRRQGALEETTKANPGMRSTALDVGDAAGVRAFAGRIEREFPALNVVVQNAGIMRPENLREQDDLTDAEATVTTNLLGPIRLTAALLPLLKRQPNAAIITVSSGLAFVPLALTPTYSATKAAIHSYSQSLRYQLRETNVQVIELIPPYVQTELMGSHQASDPNAMPLDAFIAEVVGILKTEPAATEVRVKRVDSFRFAAENGSYDGVFKTLNDAYNG